MRVVVDWDATPLNLWHSDHSVLSALIDYLRSKGISKHSIVMPDRNRGGHLFFVYETLDPAIVLAWESSR